MNSAASLSPDAAPALAGLQVGDTVAVRCNPTHYVFTDEDLEEADAEGRDLTLLSSTATVKELYPNNTVRVAIHPKSIGNVYRCSDGIETTHGHIMILVETSNTVASAANL